MGRKQMDKGQYVLLDLGNNFAAGRVLRTNPYILTLEVYQGKQKFRPGYSRETIHRIIPISKRIAELLGRFSYPPQVSLTARNTMRTSPVADQPLPESIENHCSDDVSIKNWSS